MAKLKEVPSNKPASTPEAREAQLINLATLEAERRLRDGTASPQIIVHYLKLGSSITRLEKEKLEEENNFLRSKIDALQSAKHIEELYENAMRAMKEYRGDE